MKKTLLIIAGILLVVIGVLVLSNKSSKKTVWRETFNPKEKEPYDLYILKRELPRLAHADVEELKTLKQLSNPKQQKKDQALVIIGRLYFISQATLNELDTFVKQGGTVFVATRNGEILPEGVHLDNKTINKYTTVDYFLGEKNFESPDLEQVSIFKQIESSKTKSIGSVNVDSKSFINYFSYQPKEAKGNYYIHADPIVFTNYSLLNEANYFYIKDVLQPLKGKKILWYNPSKSYDEINQSPLRYILSQPALRIAWYILLIALGLYLLFKSKRTQRIIPIVEPPKNLTVEFADTIASLYYEQGEPKDIVKKKIDHFYYSLRKQWPIEQLDFQSKEWALFASKKTQLKEEEISDLFNFLNQIYHRDKVNINDLQLVNQRIENFKTKATI